MRIWRQKHAKTDITKIEPLRIDSASIISKEQRDIDNDNSLEKLSDEQNHILLCWNVSAVAVVSVPLFGFVVDHVIDALAGSWRTVGSHNKAVAVALDFVYVWGLILFGAIVFFGNRILSDHKNKNLRTLIGGLAVFTNLSLLCAILSAGLIMASNVPLSEVFLGRFSSVVFLSFLFWTIFGIAFTLILFRQKMRSKLLFSNDYQRYESSDNIVV